MNLDEMQSGLEVSLEPEDIDDNFHKNDDLVVSGSICLLLK